VLSKLLYAFLNNLHAPNSTLRSPPINIWHGGNPPHLARATTTVPSFIPLIMQLHRALMSASVTRHASIDLYNNTVMQAHNGTLRSPPASLAWQRPPTPTLHAQCTPVPFSCNFQCHHKGHRCWQLTLDSHLLIDLNEHNTTCSAGIQWHPEKPTSELAWRRSPTPWTRNHLFALFMQLIMH
jgi:hypothetical protein